MALQGQVPLGACVKNDAPPPKKKKAKQKHTQITVIEDSLSGKKVVYKQIKHKPMLIKSNAVKQIYYKHVVYILALSCYSIAKTYSRLTLITFSLR